MAAHSWANGYGVLGLAPAKGTGAWRGDPRGGREDTVAAFAFEALTANRVRRLYEAATRSGGVDVKTIAGIAKEVERPSYQGLITGSPTAARDWALDWAATNIQGREALYAYPQLYQLRNRAFVEGYDFANLCGALWLQALWLLTAGDGKVWRCEYPGCNKIIAYEQPDPLPSDVYRYLDVPQAKSRPASGVLGYAVGMREIPENGIETRSGSDPSGTPSGVGMMEIPDTGFRLVEAHVAQKRRLGGGGRRARTLATGTAGSTKTP